MKIDDDLKSQISSMFEGLKKKPAAKAFPAPTTLSTKLGELLPPGTKGDYVTHAPAGFEAIFATAAVDMWLRAVHSFLISSSLQQASPIWACSSGYYASHYAVRAFAHALGNFQLFQRKRIVRLTIVIGRIGCNFAAKGTGDREHQFYWKVVKLDPRFTLDPLFSLNDGRSDSEVGHRDRANYADHLGHLPPFESIEAEKLRERVQYISRIEFVSPPVPKLGKFPDIDSVHILAYHRIVRFRQLLDEILGGGNRFWNIHRSPPWAQSLTDFQLVEQPGLTAYQR